MILLQTDDSLIRWHLIMSGWFVVTGCESSECWCLVPIWFLHQCHNPVKITIVKTSFAPNTLCVTPCFHPLIIVITNHTNTHWSTLHSLHKHFLKNFTFDQNHNKRSSPKFPLLQVLTDKLDKYRPITSGGIISHKKLIFLFGGWHNTIYLTWACLFICDSE